MSGSNQILDERRHLNGGNIFEAMDMPELLVIGGKEKMPDNLQNGDTFCYADDTHHSKTLQALNMMRRNKNFCDVILHTGTSDIHGHRAILAAASPILFQLFDAETEKKGNSQGSVLSCKLNGEFDKAALESLIDYAYTGRLEVPSNKVKSLYLAASQLKMSQVSKQCVQYLIDNITVENCLEIREFPRIVKNPALVETVNKFISKKFDEVSKSSRFLLLPCFKLELLCQSRQEMDLVDPSSLCRLSMQWLRQHDNFQADSIMEKTHLLYLALDNTLQDCQDLPNSDLSDSEIVQDYKKMSQRHGKAPSVKTKKLPLQPAGPRVLILGHQESPSVEEDPGWDLIAFARLGECSFAALTLINDHLSRLSVSLKLNPSPITTPDGIRASSQDPDTYQQMAHMASVKCGAGCANFNDSLLVCGGYDRGECLKVVESYDPSTNLWEALPSMKGARGRFNIAVVGKEVFAVGGSNGTTELCTVEKFDPVENKWTRVAGLPVARSNAGVCELNGKVYCIGGWSGQVGIKECDVYDPHTDSWTPIAPLNAGRNQAGVCAINGKIVAVGGCDAWSCLNSMEIYDPDTNIWSAGPPMTTNRRGCGIAVFKGKLYIVGGSDGSHSLATTEIFDWEDKNWSHGPVMATPRANVGVAVIGNRLYAVGGFSGKTFLNSMEYLDEDTKEWTTFVPKLTLPNGVNGTMIRCDSGKSIDRRDSDGASE